jgi:hypothetical protein
MILSGESELSTCERRFEELQACDNSAPSESSSVSMCGGGEDSGRGDDVAAGLQFGWGAVGAADADAMALR